jgi:hypothetical protein
MGMWSISGIRAEGSARKPEQSGRKWKSRGNGLPWDLVLEYDAPKKRKAWGDMKVDRRGYEE